MRGAGSGDACPVMGAGSEVSTAAGLPGWRWRARRAGLPGHRLARGSVADRQDVEPVPETRREEQPGARAVWQVHDRAVGQSRSGGARIAERSHGRAERSANSAERPGTVTLPGAARPARRPLSSRRRRRLTGSSRPGVQAHVVAGCLHRHDFRAVDQPGAVTEADRCLERAGPDPVGHCRPRL